MAGKTTKAATVKPRRQMPKPGSKTTAILTLATTTPATPTQIAEAVNSSRQLVHDVLNRYGLERNTVESFKQHRAEILAGKQEQILASLDDKDIKGMPVGQRIMSMGILYDKERLERGQSTDNVNVLVAGLRDLQARRRSNAVYTEESSTSNSDS